MQNVNQKRSLPMPFTRLIAAVVGLALPLAFAAAADAAPRHHHRAAHVRTATYKVAQHKAVRHHRATVANRRVAQAHRHSNLRGS